MRRAILLLSLALLGAAVPAAGARRAAAPIVRPVATGSTGSSGAFSYGVVLRNTSATKDALNVQVHVAVVGSVGLIGIYLSTIPLIPAGATFYLGNEPDLTGPQRPTGIRVAVDVGATQRRRAVLPSATARISPQGGIVGKVVNPYARALDTATSKLYAVYSDARGKVVGGDRLKEVRFPHRRIAGRSSASFTARLGSTVPRGSVARIAVSVVPGVVPR